MSDTLTFVGDPHGQAQHIIESIKEHKPQAVCLLGDMCFDRPIEQVFASVAHLCKPLWIHGNHDTDNQAWFEHIFHSPWASQNLHTRIQTFAGIKVAGLGGVFRAKIWDAHTPPKFESRKAWQDAHSHKRFAQGLAAGKRRHESSIWLEDYQKLYGNQADILLLHEAPSSHSHGFSALDDLAASMGVKLVIHGHHHYHYTSTLPNGIAVMGLALAQLAHLDTAQFKQTINIQDIVNSFTFEQAPTI